MPPGLHPLHLHHAQQTRASSTSAATPAVRSATSSDQKKNHKEVKAQRFRRSCSSTSGHQGMSSFNQSGSDQRRSSGSSIRRRVASRSHFILQERCQGDPEGYSADQIKAAITKELKQIGPQGHDAYDLVPLSLTLKERRSLIESRWVIGPRPGSELKGRFCSKRIQASHFKR